LVELLVVIAILAVLVAFALPALAGARSKADLVGGLSSLKQIGVATSLYATDNNQSLPGGLGFLYGQWPRFRPNDTAFLGSYIYPYLGVTPVGWGWQPIKAMAGPAWWRMNPDPNNGKFPSYIINRDVKLPDGTIFQPWGDGKSIPPMRLHAIASAGLMRTWALRDVDAISSPFGPSAWGGLLPASPLYGKSRLQLNFDMSAEVVSSSLNTTQNR